MQDTAIDVATLNSRGYVDIRFVATSGNTIVAAGITDSGNEFTLSGTALNTVVFNGAPTLVEGSTYRYSFSGKFVPGTVALNFIAGSWQDSGGNLSIDETHDFTAAGPTAALTNGLDKPTVGLSVINGRHYIDVRYKPTSGSAPTHPPF